MADGHRRFDLITKATDRDGRLHIYTRITVSEARPAGDWPAWPQSQAAAAALAAELADGAPLESCVEELQNCNVDGVRVVAARRVHASPDEFAHPRGSAAAALPMLLCVGGDDRPPSAVLLTHTFALPTGGGGGGGGGGTQRLRLTTLVVPEGPRQMLLDTLFGAGARIALPSPDGRTFTDVELDDARVDAAALALWPLQMRAALKAAQRAQRLAGVAACIQARWAGGFSTLQLYASKVRPDISPSLAAVATRLAVAYAGGAATRTTLLAREHEAEALEAAGRYLEAAALYKQNVDEDARNPAARLLQVPARQWSFYGLALKRAGRYQEALAAYEAGLRVLQTGPIDPDTPQWRESTRLSLLQKLITLAQAMHDQQLYSSTCARIFERQMDEMHTQGDTEFVFEFKSGGGDYTACITGCATARRFAVVDYRPPAGDTVHAGLTMSHVVELSRETDLAASISECSADWSFARGTDAALDLRFARQDLGKSHGAAELPSLPKLRCALCGAPAPKRCGACGGPPYCGPACQRAHWKAHKPACKAARAAGGAASKNA